MLIEKDEIVETHVDGDGVYIKQPNKLQNHFRSEFDFRIKNDIPEFYDI